MACDLVATMLFVFCHVVSTVEIQTGEDQDAENVTDSVESNDAMDHNHEDTPKIIPEPLVHHNHVSDTRSHGPCSVCFDFYL